SLGRNAGRQAVPDQLGGDRNVVDAHHRSAELDGAVETVELLHDAGDWCWRNVSAARRWPSSRPRASPILSWRVTAKPSIGVVPPGIEFTCTGYRVAGKLNPSQSEHV